MQAICNDETSRAKFSESLNGFGPRSLILALLLGRVIWVILVGPVNVGRLRELPVDLVIGDVANLASQIELAFTERNVGRVAFSNLHVFSSENHDVVTVLG